MCMNKKSSVNFITIHIKCIGCTTCRLICSIHSTETQICQENSSLHGGTDKPQTCRLSQYVADKFKHINVAHTTDHITNQKL